MSKHAIYISFYDENSKKVVPEHIPGDYTKFGMWIRERLCFLYFKLGIESNYWNFRYVLDFETRKTEDLLFIIHVLEEHDGKPPYWRERLFYERLVWKYDAEVRTFILPYINEKNEQNPIVHPYYLAYKKRWLKPKYSQTRRFYHGMDINELSVLMDSFKDRRKAWAQNYRNKHTYYKKQLKKP